MKDEEAWKQVVAQLNAAYSVGGREALGKMTNVEVFVLHSEKMLDLREAKARCAQYPEDELGKIRVDKAERESADISGWLKDQSKGKESKEPDMER